MSLRAPVQRHNALLSSVSCLLKRTPASPPTRRPLQCRYNHTVPALGRHDAAFRDEGIPALYTSGGFDMAWTSYQGHTLERLDDLLSGDVRQNWTPKAILLDTARNPATANTFNYASMAHNNHFYFSCLSPTPTEIPPDLATSLTKSFSTLDTFRKTFITTALAMFGPGFVWLVQLRDAPLHSTNRPRDGGFSASTTPAGSQLDFRILTTYLAGSPYPGAHTRQQNRDMNTTNLQDSEDYYRQTTTQNTAGTFGKYSQRGQAADSIADPRRYGGADVVPVLCVNTWEHAWMWDWGVGGKRWFLETWWDRVDWDVVASHCVLEPAQKRFMR